ncbi:hypothetical protein GCM10009304_30020 [Pseudomonas matsuisoli]|uniref:Uncharacterized protein n=1 Tax=Pseudomonas matsuisoli TaxID=1515666 RepID=A0A917PZL3_9PSED|nr:hypothetical protein GCM10009304_30020 [Pseudomonas matsuisoli]
MGDQSPTKQRHRNPLTTTAPPLTASDPITSDKAANDGLRDYIANPPYMPFVPGRSRRTFVSIQ